MNKERSRPLLLDTDALRKHLVQLCREEIDPKADLVDYKVGNQHHDYLVLLVRLRHPSLEVVVKLAGPEASIAPPFDRTAALQHLVALRTKITMPDIIGVDVSCRKWPWRYFIKTYVPGIEWAVVRNQMATEQLSSAHRQIGEAVAQLHTIRFPAFGKLTTDVQVQNGYPLLTALREQASHYIKSARLRDHFFAALDQYVYLFKDTCEASLCHEDLHGHNILFENRQGRWMLATILDFDKAWAGHHETDLARLDLWKGMTNQDFWRAYEAVHPIDPLFEQRRPIYQLLWCLEYARPTTDHLADTRRVCEEQGVPIIRHFG